MKAQKVFDFGASLNGLSDTVHVLDAGTVYLPRLEARCTEPTINSNKYSLPVITYQIFLSLLYHWSQVYFE